MSQFTYVINNFTAGELSPLLQGHSDLQRYKNGCSTLENFLPHPLGGALLMDGTRFISQTYNNHTARLLPFVVSDDQAYVVELSNLVARFLKGDALVYPSGSVTPYSIGSPYTTAQLTDIAFAQSADTMFLVHPEVVPYTLKRTLGGAFPTFAMAVLDIWDGPYLPLNTDMDCYLTPSETTGICVLSATSGKVVFHPEHVGALFRLRHSGASMREPFASGTGGTPVAIYGKFTVDISPYQATSTDPVFSGQMTLQRSENTGPWMDVASFFYSSKQEFVETKPNVRYRLLMKDWTSGLVYGTIYQDEAWSVYRVTEYVGTEIVNAQILVQPPAADVGTAEWREGAWSDYRGYPRCVCFFQDRLVFAGTSHQPQTWWSSWTSDYTNFMPDMAEDDAALTFTPDARDASPYFWLLPHKTGLLAGGLSGVDLFSSGDAKPITPKNPPTYAPNYTGGCASGVRPIQAASAIVYVDRSRKKLLELTYDVQQDGLSSVDLNQLASHVCVPGIVSMAFQENPIPRFWCVLDDGTMAILTYLRKEQVVAWTRWVTDGLIKDVCIVPSAMGAVAGTDKAYVVVDRGFEVIYLHETITSMCVEVVVPNDDNASLEDCFFVDSGVSETKSPPGVTITGLDHLEYKSVTGLMDGMVIPISNVSSGSITLPFAVSKIIVGLAKTGTVIPMKMDLQAGADATIQNKVKRVIKCWMRVYRSLGGFMGPSLTTLDEIPQLFPGMTLDDPMAVKTELIEMAFAGDPDVEGDVVVVQTQPLPLKILSIISKVSVE